MRRGLAIGCGGTLGAAWTVGALVAVEEALGWDPREAAAMIGTSAGAEFVTVLGGGVGVGELLDAQLGKPEARSELRAHLAAAPGRFPPVPRFRVGSPKLLRANASPMTRASGLLPIGRGDASWLAELAGAFAPTGWVAHPSAWVVGVDYDTGERVAFGSPGAPEARLADAIRASWAIPGWFPPVEIGGRRYIDGGAASPASVDLLPDDLDEIVVLAPMTSSESVPAKGFSRFERLLRTPMTRRLDAEIAARGTRVLRLEPGPEDLAVLGANFMDGRRRRRALETALRTTRAKAAAW
ncbi:patatin-like phospholipase family protein [Amycolatopsis minnesotensis]|uniref:Patatin-like phospholipase family protein n=1 Tax=Amycolatopsis minnesotensis TaxID=337894 RepID=A0ABN2SRC3_9PSEU